MFIEKEEAKIIQKIIKKFIPKYEVWAFGSRVHGQHLKKFSDLDIIILNQKEIDINLINDLKNAFADSNLPFRVDVIDWLSTDKPFQKIIKSNHEVIFRPNLTKSC